MKKSIISTKKSSWKFLKILALLALAMISISLVSAADIQDISVNPGNTVWMSQNFNISGQCNPANPQDAELFVENLTIIESSGTTRPNLDSDDLRFDNIQGILRKSAIEDYLIAPGHYFFDLKCQEISGSDTDSYSGNFTANKLDLSFSESFSEVYTGTSKIVKLNLESKPFSGDITDKVDFSASIGGDSTDIIAPTPYFRNGNWFLNLSMPDEGGEKTLKIVAEHKGASATVSKDIQLDDSVSYKVGLDRTQLNPGETLEWGIDAEYKGEDVEISKEDVEVTFDGEDITEDLTEKDIAPSNSIFEIEMPEEDPGSYTLELEIDIKGRTITEERTIVYPLKVKGSFKDDTNNIPFVIEFIEGGTVESSIEGEGEYSKEVAPGEREVRFRFHDSKHAAELLMREVEVESWEDPLKFFRGGNGEGKVDGMILEALYGFESSIDSSSTGVKLSYTSGNVRNPENVGIFRCRGWNFDSERCYSGWEEMAASFDRVKKEASFNTSDLEGAFALGRRDKLLVKYSLDQKTYNPNDDIEVEGVVQNGRGNTVKNATVFLESSSIQIVEETTTDDKGQFSLSFSAPDQADSYDMDIVAFKSPFREAREETSFKLVKDPEMEIVVPDEIKLEPNSSREVKMYLRNTGFVELDNIVPYTEDVPFLRLLQMDGRPLGVNESKEAHLEFSTSPNVSVGTHKAEMTFSYAGENISEVFGVTIEEESSASSESTDATDEGGSSLTGNMISAAYESMSPLYLLIVGLLLQAGIVVFFVARNKGKGYEKDVSGVVSTIKGRLDDEESGEFKGGEKGVERQRIIQNISRIKENLEDHRQVVEP